jgi:CheY-like chemotaxis protein
MTEDSRRRPWTGGPEAGATPDSWLALDDDEILYRIARLSPDANADPQLLEVVKSSRHFFVRQEAAKHVRNRDLLFPYEDDRHIGQILVRHLNRKEDLTYLGQLAAHSRYSEVRKAAQVQLGRLQQRSQGLRAELPAQTAPEAWRVAVLHADPNLLRVAAAALSAPEFDLKTFGANHDALASLVAFDPHLVMADVAHFAPGSPVQAAVRRWARYVPLIVVAQDGAPDTLVEVLGRGADEFLTLPVHPTLLTAKVRALLHFAHRGVGATEPAAEARPEPSPARQLEIAPAQPVPTPAPKAAVPPPPAPSEAEGADPTLLAWAIHFLVEHTWGHLGTMACITLLRRTQELLVSRHPVLRRYQIGENAHVTVDLSPGIRFRQDSVSAVAAWMAAFLDAAGRVDSGAATIDVRSCTALMSDALTRTGFYRAYDAAARAAEQAP